MNYPVSVFIDTNVFEAAKFDFSSTSVLNKLIEFVDEGYIKIYLSNIVVYEVTNHIKKHVKEICNKRKKLHGEIFKLLAEPNLELTSFSDAFSNINKNKLEDEMVKLFDDFLKKSAAEILNSEGVDCNKIVLDYFHFEPPFENNDKKRHEFPDAIMAAKLRNVFSNSELHIIGTDKGLKKALENIEDFVFHESLKEMFDLINKENESVYSDIKEFIESDQSFAINMKNDIYNYIMDNNVDVDGCKYDRNGVADGHVYDETYVMDVSEINFEFYSIDRISTDIVSVTLQAAANIVVDCSYFDEENSAWDNEEKEYILEVTGKVLETHKAEFDIEVEIKINDNDYEIYDIFMDIVLDEDTCIHKDYDWNEFEDEQNEYLEDNYQ